MEMQDLNTSEWKRPRWRGYGHAHQIRRVSGRGALYEWLEREGVTSQEFARALRRRSGIVGLRTNGSRIHSWVTGSSRPRPLVRRAIERLTDGQVPAASWE